MATVEGSQATSRIARLMWTGFVLSILAGCAARGAETMGRQETTSDETAIRQLHERFGDAWSRGDVSALVNLFAEDAVRVGVGGDIQSGREAIRAALEGLLSGRLSGASVKLGRGSVRILSPNLALWQGSIEIIPGPDRPSLKGYAVDVMSKVGSTWLILETHPKLFPPPAPAPQ